VAIEAENARHGHRRWVWQRKSIRYWDVSFKREGERNPLDLVLNFYFIKSDLDSDAHDKPLTIQECIKQLNFSRQKLKDVVSKAKEHSGQYKV
jgi:hypothetical protein